MIKNLMSLVWGPKSNAAIVWIDYGLSSQASGYYLANNQL
jgi:hypothetical protein